MDSYESVKSECIVRGIKYESINSNQYSEILSTISDNNMDIALLETVPKIRILLSVWQTTLG